MKGNQPFSSILLGILALSILIPWQAIQADPPANIFKRRYVFASSSWNTPSAVTEYKQLLNRIKDAGYNMVCLHNFGFMFIQNQKQSWFDNFKLVKAEADKIGMPLMVHHGVQRIPSYHDLNLAEAYPAKGTQFQVTGNQAVVKPDHQVVLKNTGFEEWTGEAATNWIACVVKPGESFFRDNQVKHTGNSSVRITNPPYGAMMYQNIKVKPFRAYRLSFWIKTDNYSLNNHVSFGVRVKDVSRWLLFIRHSGTFGWGSNAVGKSQNWKKHVLDFNSLSYEDVMLQVRLAHMTGPGKGSVWIDDVKIEEVGLYEAVTRKSAPIKVTSSQTGKDYVPGKDYTLSIKAQPLHQGRLLIPAGSSIQDGELLKVDWYQLANTDHYHAPGAVACIDEFYQAMEKDLRIIDDMFGGLQAIHVGAGEWREAFWDPTCTSMYNTAGEYMADFAQRTRDMLRKINPQMQIDFKNDMYDPYHNAHGSFYSVNGDISGSWHGITQDLFMWNWRPPRSSSANVDDPFYKSLMLFGGLDPAHPMKPVSQIMRIFGDGGALNLDLRLDILDLAEKNGLRNVEGIMYNTWYNQYDALEKLPETCKKEGRWADNPYPGAWPVLCPNGGCQAGIAEKDGSPGRFSGNVRLGTRIASTGNAHILLNLKVAGEARIRILNARGQMVQQIANGFLQSGRHELTWNAGQHPAGIYLVQVKVKGQAKGESNTLARKLAILR